MRSKPIGIHFDSLSKLLCRLPAIRLAFVFFAWDNLKSCMSDFAIRTAALTRDFSAVRALDGLTLEVPAGSVLGFLGPNGAGKTTTIRLLLGLIQPTSGRAEVLGVDTASKGHEVRCRTGALLEHSVLYEL